MIQATDTEPRTRRARPGGDSAVDLPVPDAPRRTPSRLYRLRRKLRRLANELRSIHAERLKLEHVVADPVLLNLNHTTICNLRCMMCVQALEDVPQQVMQPEVYRRIRDELFDRVSHISLTVMGDPFCVPRAFFDEILDDVEHYDLRLELTTNATLLGKDEELERLARLTNKMVFSFDGATKETFERIRVPAKWDSTVANIERFCRIRRAMPAHRRPLIYFNYVLMRSNLEEFPRFIDLASSWDAYSVAGSPLITVHPDIAHEAVDTSDPHVVDVLSEARDRAFANGVGFHVDGAHVGFHGWSPPWGPSRIRQQLSRWWIPFKPAASQGLGYLAGKILHRIRVAPRECGFLWNKVYVQMDGKVTTCCHPNNLYTGDITADPFREIWNGKRYRALRAALNTDHPAPPCRDCHLLRS